jgi:SAM-dependent methyltransferase
MEQASSPPPHGPTEPSDWVRRFTHLIPSGGAVLDLAAGAGRHTRLMLGVGHRVTAIDRDVSHLAALVGSPALEIIQADLEIPGGAWPLGERLFAGIVVTNYLHRPLFGHLRAALAEGGALIYETFGVGNERFGKPDNPDFLLKPGELLELARGLQIAAYENLEIDTPRRAIVQRIAARAM